jgi:phytoene dehydrogenase-like protein
LGSRIGGFEDVSARPRIAILGGGIAGCVLAAELARGGEFAVDLYERGDRLGGLHHSPVFGSLAFDIGPFFFDSDHQLFKTFPDLRDTFVRFPVKAASIGRNGAVDRYPISVRGYLRNYGKGHFIRALADIAVSKIRHRKRDSLPAYIQYYLGGSIYRQSGLRTYIERLYSMPDTQVDLMFAEHRMGDLRKWASLRKMLWRLLSGPRALIPSAYAATALARPAGGFSSLYADIEEALVSRGVNVVKNAEIGHIAGHDGAWRLHCRDGDRAYGEIASTIPLPALAALIREPVEHRFETVSLLSLFYTFRGDPGYDATMICNFCDTGRWKRITDFSRIYGKDGDRHYFAAEIPLAPGANPDVDAERAGFERHVASLGLFAGELGFQGSCVTRNAYPVYRAEAVAGLAADRRRIADRGIRLAGRQGRFEYISSNLACEAAFALAAEMRAEYGARA